MEFPFSIVSGRTVDSVVQTNVPRVVETVRNAYLTHDRGETVNPNSYFLRFPQKPNARIIALPAFLGGEAGVAGIKWIASYPDNVRRGFPRASAVILLNSYETGYPFACLEASIISAVRTAGSAVLAAEELNRGIKSTATLGIVGNGFIARYLYGFFVGMGWEIERVLLHDLNEDDAKRFAANVCDASRHEKVGVSSDVSELVRESTMVAFVTTASSPYVDDPELFSHRPLVLNISLRDLSVEVVLAHQNFVDDVDHVMNANTSVHLAEQRTGSRDFVAGTLADVMLGRVVPAEERGIVFSPFGMGILDIAVARWVYHEACASGEARPIEDFFFELER